MKFPDDGPELPAKGIPKKIRAAMELLIAWMVKHQFIPGFGLSVSEQANGLLVNAGGTKSGGGSIDCPLGATLVKVEGDEFVEFAWGRIVGRQPTGFTAGGATPYRLPALANNYYYASAVFDWEAMQWTGAAVEYSADPFKMNTGTRAYSLLCSVGTSGGVLSIQSQCGDVWFTPCDLALPE